MVDGRWLPLVRLIVPPRCSVCHGPAASGLICAGCRDSLPWNRSACPVCALPQQAGQSHVCARCSAQLPDYDVAWSAFRHEAPVAQAIYGLKYHAQFRR